MSLDEAIKQMQSSISAASTSAVVKVVKMSEEEVRLSVYAAAGDIEPVKNAAFQPAIGLLNKHGRDVQVFVYDIAVNPPPG